MAFPHAYHQALISDFLDAIRDGRDPLICGEEALKVHHFIDALLASNGRSVPITDVVPVVR
jgi:UDP-N-acetyl-2-amino-2-deoxyglucuronate dehydrogenase